MDVPSPSSGGRKPRKPRKLESAITPMRLKETTGLSIGSLTLDKPSGVPCDLKWAREVCLDLASKNDAAAFKILTEIYHPNILHLESIIGESGSSIKICVDPYTHSLENYVGTLGPEVTEIQSLLRQIAEGIHELILNGMHHGNFSIKTTYFDKSSQLVKLAQFHPRDGMGKEQAQFNDWNQVGNGVAEILKTLKTNYPMQDYSVLDDLAQTLKNLSQSSSIAVMSVKDRVLEHVFFWNEDRRASFFIYGIQGAMHNGEFIRRVEALRFIPDDWNLNDHKGLLTEMDSHRKKKGMPVYKSGKHQYVLFVSGCYTHETELGTQGVDSIITGECPCLCLELVKIVRDLGHHV